MNGVQSFDLSGSNCDVEIRGGGRFEDFSNGSGTVPKTGTGTWNFTTNNQTINGQNNSFNFACNVVIATGITVTVNGATGLIFSNTLNGASSTATFNNTGKVTYTGSSAPMSTGKLYCNQTAGNTFIYGALGNQDITVPSDTTPGYQNLTLSGSGAKRLLGNVSVKGTYTLTGPATLNSNGFALTNP